jgi:hypothetical protein
MSPPGGTPQESEGPDLGGEEDDGVGGPLEALEHGDPEAHGGRGLALDGRGELPRVPDLDAAGPAPRPHPGHRHQGPGLGSLQRAAPKSHPMEGTAGRPTPPTCAASSMMTASKAMEVSARFSPPLPLRVVATICQPEGSRQHPPTPLAGPRTEAKAMARAALPPWLEG